MQHLRIRYTVDEDANTAFYHRISKSRKSQNQIVYFSDDSGNIIDDLEGIKSHAISYYQDLLGSSLPSTSSPLDITSMYLVGALRRIRTYSRLTFLVKISNLISCLFLGISHYDLMDIPLSSSNPNEKQFFTSRILQQWNSTVRVLLWCLKRQIQIGSHSSDQ